MAVRQFRSIVAKFVIVTGLAFLLLAGSSVLVVPRDASAMTATDAYCEFAIHYFHMASYYYDAGNLSLGNYYYSKGSNYLGLCEG
jgi:hypothetical protein